ncbi:MAG TPA: TIGR00730 family Rossman fold protein [Ferruginibacter sp.]|nr:TIGR00730 family Rossman fold protein [Ferruginibacter sp.]
MQVHALAVFCGSKKGNDPLFEKQAVDLGHLLADRNITLIYGGGSVGLMGITSNAVLEKSGKVIGIIPSILKDREVHHEGITELIVVDNMHTRKKMLYEKCDAAIILPGGFGTMDEFFEMLTWNQLSIHDKKIFILNTNGFYDYLLALTGKMQQEGFLYDRPGDRLLVIHSPEELVAHLG